MTSLLKSKFNLANRRALLLSAQKIAVYHWRRGDIGSSYMFDVTREGRDYFARYLRETPNTPMYVLVDLFEEEYRRDTIPHVYGPDRTAILSRKKARLFRDTPFFHYRVQGREAEGRRDDRILMTAITNPHAVIPWIDLFDEFKVPLGGIYSLPLFTESLARIMPVQSNHMLIVSMQSISGLRQTFLHNGEFRISRLVQLPRYGTAPYAPHIRDEVEKIRRYLNSLRITQLDESLDIFFLVAGDLCTELRKEYQDSGLTRYHVLDINKLLESSGSQRRISTPFSDQLFAHQLLRQKPANYYATPSQRRFFTMRRMRHMMLAASALFLLGGAIWGGFNFMDGLSFKQRSMSAQLQTRFYSQRYKMAKERLPHTPVEPADLQAAVKLAEVLHEYKSSPLEMMRLISRGLQSHAVLQVDRIDWMASTDPQAEPGDSSANTRNRTPSRARKLQKAVPGELTKAHYKYYQIAVVNGKLSPFGGDYRDAISTINHFAESLRMQQDVYEVNIRSLPLDISSDASVRGSTQSRQTEALFSLRIVLGIGNEA